MISATAAMAPPIIVPSRRSRPRRPDPPTVDCSTNTAPMAAGPVPPGRNSALSTSASAMPDTAALALVAAAASYCESAARIVGALPSGLAGGKPSGSASAADAAPAGSGRSVSAARSVPPLRRA